MEVDGEHQIKTVVATAERPEWAGHWDESQEEEEKKFQTGSTNSPATTTTSGSDSIDYSAYVTLIPWELIQQNGKSEKLQEMREALLSQQREEEQRVRQQAIYRDERVRVVIHNITQISESDVQKWNNSEVDGADTYVNQKL